MATGNGYNPYLAHNDASGSSDAPLSGWIPRKVSEKQVDKAMNGATNPFTLQPHSSRYYDILAARKKLPVHQQMGDFLRMFSESQFIVMVGETGSGKTTQSVSSLLLSKLQNEC